MSKSLLWKLAASVGGILATALVGASFLWNYQMQQAEKELRREQQRNEIRAEEERIQSTLVRVYQNLRLNHFLAAQRNLESIAGAEPQDPILKRDYYDAVSRVAEGLLENNFHDESEVLFMKLASQEQYEERAREAIGLVASSRRRDSARRFLATGKELLTEKRYRDASAELRKARLEFESVELFRIHDVSEEMKDLNAVMKVANYHVAIIEAEYFINQAEVFMEQANFLDSQSQLRRASVQLAKARFYRPGSEEEIERLRNQMIDIEHEIAVRFPNSIPIHNKYENENISEVDDYFLLTGYKIQRSPKRVQLELSYRLNLEKEDYFVVRYRIHFHNGLHFNNGHFLKSEDQSEGEKPSVLFIDQELPEHLWSEEIKTVDIRVYNARHEMISRLTRAYRREG